MGEKSGHPFRGNQYTASKGGGKGAAGSPKENPLETARQQQIASGKGRAYMNEQIRQHASVSTDDTPRLYRARRELGDRIRAGQFPANEVEGARAELKKIDKQISSALESQNAELAAKKASINAAHRDRVEKIISGEVARKPHEAGHTDAQLRSRTTVVGSLDIDENTRQWNKSRSTPVHPRGPFGIDTSKTYEQRSAEKHRAVRDARLKAAKRPLTNAEENRRRADLGLESLEKRDARINHEKKVEMMLRRENRRDVKKAANFEKKRAW